MARDDENRLVDEAVVENKLVVVAFVVVELPTSKVEKVDEAVEKSPFRKATVVEVDTP